MIEGKVRLGKLIFPTSFLGSAESDKNSTMASLFFVSEILARGRTEREKRRPSTKPSETGRNR
jgi:hypothetical protein